MSKIFIERLFLVCFTVLINFMSFFTRSHSSFMDAVDTQKDISTDEEKETNSVTKSVDESKINKPQENHNLRNFSSFDSFDGYQNDNFKPMRRSSLLKMNENSVVVSSLKCDLEQNESKSLNEKQTSKHLTSSEKEKLVGDLTLIFDDDVTLKRNKEKKKEKAVPTFTNEPRTRSGRTVQKPGAYWSSNHR